MTNWLTVADIKQTSMVKFEMLGFSVEEDYDTWIEETLLPRCESVINDYCGVTFTDVTAGHTVKLVCSMLASHIIHDIILNATSPIVTVSDYQVMVASVNVFDNNLKELLKPHRDNQFIHSHTDYQTDEIKDVWDE